jgi:putative methionine-R-sulfoxide reductase with GAF domain
VSSKRDAYRAIVDAVDRMVNRGDDADTLLRCVVDLLHDRLDHCSRAGIYLVEEGRLALGPARGYEGASRSELAVPIAYEGRAVGEIRVHSAAAEAFDEEDRHSLERVAVLISQHALVAWDTRGQAWNP